MPAKVLRQLLVSTVTLLPEGGQRTARQNAWVAVGENARRARDRREADAALAALPRGAAPHRVPSAAGSAHLPN